MKTLLTSTLLAISIISCGKQSTSAPKSPNNVSLPSPKIIPPATFKLNAKGAGWSSTNKVEIIVDTNLYELKPQIQKAVDSWNSVLGGEYLILKTIDSTLTPFDKDYCNKTSAQAACYPYNVMSMVYSKDQSPKDSQEAIAYTNTQSLWDVFVRSSIFFLNTEHSFGDVICTNCGQIPEHMMDMQSISLHELGHLLGLSHSNSPSDIMYPYISSKMAKRTLSPCDINRMQANYNGVELTEECAATVMK